MNWIDRHVRPRLKNIFARRETPENLWIKCPATGELVFHNDVKRNAYVVPKSGYHMAMTARQRLDWFFDPDTSEDIEIPDSIADPLKFRDQKRYVDRLREARARTELSDSLCVSQGTVHDLPVTVAAQAFEFMGGTLGVAAGSAFCRGAEHALETQTPYVVFTASGGARMQEGMFALMQLPRTVIAVRALREAGIPFIVVLTNPTTGGVSASFGMLGDIHLAEPGALIGFAGPRVIKQTIRESLPEGFQRAEYLKEHGMIDQVVHRHELKATISSIIRLIMKKPAFVPEKILSISQNPDLEGNVDSGDPGSGDDHLTGVESGALAVEGADREVAVPADCPDGETRDVQLTTAPDIEHRSYHSLEEEKPSPETRTATEIST